MSDQDKKNNNTNEDLNTSLHELLIKQQALLLQQSEFIAKEKQRQKEEADEIDLSRLVPKFLKKKKEQPVEEIIDKKTGRRINININKPDFQTTKSGIKSFWLFITNQFNFIMKNRYFLIVITSLGLIGGIIIYLNSPKQYRSTMTLASGDFDNTYYANLIANLQDLAENKSYIGLAKKLNLDTIITQNVTNIQYQDYLERYLMKEDNDSLLGEINRPYFKVTVDVYYNSILPYLEKGIFNFLKENKYVNKKLAVKKQILQNSIKEIDNQLMSYDSLKNAVIKNIQTMNNFDNPNYTVKESGLSGGGIILSQEDKMQLEPLKPFDKADELIREKISKQKELLLLDENFDLVDGFAPNDKPVSPRILDIIIKTVLAFVFGVILLYLFLFIKFIFTYKVKREV